MQNMWRILQCTKGLQPLRCGYLIKQTQILQSNVVKGIHSNSRRVICGNTKSTYTIWGLTKIGFGFACGVLVKVSSNKKAFCEVPSTRMVGYEMIGNKELKFDWLKLWYYLKPHLRYLIAAIIGALAVALLNIQIPQIMGGIINVVAKFSDTQNSKLFLKEMRDPALKLITMYIVQSAFTFFYIDMLSRLGEKIAFHIKTDLFATIIKQDLAFFDEQRTGEIVHRLTSDIQDFKHSFKQTISGGLRACTQIVGCAISLIIISPQMTFITLFCVPAIIALGTGAGTVLRHTSRKAQAQFEKSTAVADEAISNIRTVRAFAMESQEIATLYMGGYLLSTNQLSAGQLMAYLMATQTIQRSMAQLSLLFGSVVRGVSAGARIFEYLDMKPTMNLHGGKIPNCPIKGNIEFRNVTFAYPTRPEDIILSNFNLIIEAGKTIAIVGASGNGKSTIAALLERFYDVNKGMVTLDGEDITTLDPSWLRGHALGYISQEPILFATDIMENIRYGRPSATDDEVKKAAQLSHAHEFIESFPNGYQTMVGERGVTLSGGQKQRVAIARALLKKPSILILDEATSALDTESEKVVQAALDKARAGRTVLIIAHRLSTIRNADLIVVLSKGNIVEMGTHEELKNMKGLYWSLNFQQHHDNPT